ncbi:exodeoxyribonuclease III [Saccharospirillum sp. MSK14-1]|uniref:exodeoxyribonuclease III n=1 Tax=Saccharospirillum sp. MSK14-1 TaxID=1897632 RepID=UPI000D3BBDB7|nr:exodeoxyribonuclease III [Saccharospirillum sp. MSK14-1]PTY37309.1 exodeoxyribonuclease III [Saccharospirillum sp. MSK14-1]
MRIISFNINGIRARLHQLDALRRLQDPDILCLQEIKVHDDMYPHDDVQQASGLQSVTWGQKGHFGVATLSRTAPQSVERGFPDDEDDAHRRMLISRHAVADGHTLTVLNGYFPQGESIHHETKWPAKRRFYADLLAWLENNVTPDDLVIVLGDFNIAPVDEDLGIGEKNVKRWLRDGKSAFQPEERAWFEKLRDWGLTDSYRHLYPDNNEWFSWFDYRSKGFEDTPKRGLRIDHLLVSAPLVPLIRGAGIDYEIRALEKPSDHAPAWLDLDLKLV